MPRGTFARFGVSADYIRPLMAGEQIRDFCVDRTDEAFVPYDSDHCLVPLSTLACSARVLWNYRATLQGILSFGDMTKFQLGEPWWAWYRWIAERYRASTTITYAEIASHTHFIVRRGGDVLNRTAPIIKLPSGASEDDYLSLVGLLNSSTACFLLKQVSQKKQMTGGDGVRVSSRSKVPYQFAGTRIEQLPLRGKWNSLPLRRDLAQLSRRAEKLSKVMASSNVREAIRVSLISGENVDDALGQIIQNRALARSNLICIQEDIDFLCYFMYGLAETVDIFGADLPSDVKIEAGDRPFCILSQLDENGFDVPVDVPPHWPTALHNLWVRRMELTQSFPDLQLIEDAHYKRRWIGLRACSITKLNPMIFALG